MASILNPQTRDLEHGGAFSNHCGVIIVLSIKAPAMFKDHVVSLVYEMFINETDFHWRGHQTSQKVVSLKGRLPQKLQSKFTLSCEVIQIHSLFRHGFYKETDIKS